MRFLGVDFGERRIGLAISDDGARIATPRAIVERRSDAQAIAAITAIIGEEGVGAIVVGEPRRDDGERGGAARRARSFARKLQAATGLATSMTDEALTSHEAAARLRQSLPTRGRTDAVAAQILLQQVLDEPAAAAPLPAPAPSPGRSSGER